MTIRTVEMDFNFMNYIPQPPRSPDDLYAQACSSDKITVKSWHKIWIDQIRENHTQFGPFFNQSIGKHHKKFEKRPCIVMGSGPSLAFNCQQLSDNKGVPIISCLHNFHFCIDNNIPVDAFVTLDAGKIVIEEISEGGKEKHDYYVEKTKDHTLYAYIGTPIDLLNLWKGPIFFFNAPIPDPMFMKDLEEIEKFGMWVSSGGNVLGACTYIAKAVWGCNPIAWVGADFSFSYKSQFHGWKSKYDNKLGVAMRAIDIYGNCVKTWQSYFNFKNFFEFLAMSVPGLYINCTEGGILGAYPDGNIMQILQMELKNFLRMYSVCEDITDQCNKPELNEMKILY